MASSVDWAAFRSLVPSLPGRINLNAGTLSPTPRPVVEAASRMREQLHANGTEFVVNLLPPLVQESRRRLADYLNCDTGGLLLLPNVTFAMNIAIDSLPLSPGDEVLLTSQEYGAMKLAWARRAQVTGAVVRFVDLPPDPQSPDDIVERVTAALTDRTRVLFFSHITSPTGLILPAEALCALARQRGIVSVIDGAHAPGMIPVDLRRIGADLYGANCHKWMMAAPGSGFLHAAEGVRRLLRPPIASWGMDYVLDRLDEDSDWGGSFWQRSFEYMGIVDRTPQCTIPAAIDFRNEIGEANVAQRVAELTRYARHRLEGAGLKCVSRDDPRLTGAMLLFDYHEVPEPSWRNAPWWEARKIVAPVTNHEGRYFVRVCCAWFNTEQEIDALAEVVESR